MAFRNLVHKMKIQELSQEPYMRIIPRQIRCIIGLQSTMHS